ncbi:MAG: hypothetical protein ACI8ZB_001088 [Desulforhopalus sp.]|jgi:hypothetical protein
MKKRIARVIQSLKDFTIVGFTHYIILKLRKKEIIIGGSCHCCGDCCRRLSLDDGNGWIRSKKKFAVVVSANPQYKCFEIIGTDNNGYLLFACTLLSDDGKCGDYSNRFQFCRDFPDKNLIFCGGGLPSGCGYRFQSVVPFAKILNETIEKTNEKSPDT